MKALIVVLLIVPIISTVKERLCPHAFYKIISGDPAAAGQFPWQASLICFLATYSTFCGGSLITTRWVLTAAHCVQSVRKVEVRLGTVKCRGADEKESVLVTTDRVIVHPDYVKNRNDVAVVDLKTNVNLSAYIKTIPLGAKNVGFGVPVTVSGCGMTSNTGSLSSTLLFVDLRTITNPQCQQYFDYVPNNVLCCQGEYKRSTCHGDSGSPLVTYDEKGNAVLVGIAAFVLKCSCTAGAPSGYTKIYSFYKWILSSIEE